MQKINSYIGFAKRSAKIVFGQDSVLKSKNVYLVLASNNLSPNTINKLQTKAKTIVLANQQYSMLNEEALAIGIQDSNLADAIIKELNNLGE